MTADESSAYTARMNGFDAIFPCMGPNDNQMWGLNKRELFAAMAMESLAAHYAQGGDFMADHVAKGAVLLADALLKELAK